METTHDQSVAPPSVEPTCWEMLNCCSENDPVWAEQCGKSYRQIGRHHRYCLEFPKRNSIRREILGQLPTAAVPFDAESKMK